MSTIFEHTVTLRYNIYNSLFLDLPFRQVFRTGTMLPLLLHYCEAGYSAGGEPRKIIEKYFQELVPELDRADQLGLLFNFIQYIERQVVLFDAVEDAAFDAINDTRGPGTVTALVARAQQSGMMNELRQKLDSFRVRVVLTAHPTQFYPSNVLGIINDLEKAIRGNDLQQINLLLQQLGKTPFINKERPTPYDEAVSLAWYLEYVFYPAAAQLVGELLQGLGLDVTTWQNYRLITIGFWPGGDRDGNPYVTSDVTLKVAKRLRETVLKCYYRDLKQLRRRLTFRGVESYIRKAERQVYATIYYDKRDSDRDIYRNADDLLQDLFCARRCLVEEHGSLFLDLLDNLILKVQIFAFFMASIDIRQDGRQHEAVWEDLLSRQSPPLLTWQQLTALPPPQQIDTLLSLRPNVAVGDLDPFTVDVVNTIKAIGVMQQQGGEEACHRYIISNCRSALQVIQVFQLSRLLLAESAPLRLDIVPLFETIDDLANAAVIIDQLYGTVDYRDHIRRRDDKQIIMLGFSDGTKDGGYLRANWSIFRAKETLTEVSRRHGVKVVFFDGRGGPPARGGGNTHDFYASLGDTIEDEEIQITIQGQTVSANYGKVVSAKYNLEQLLSAGIANAILTSDLSALTATDRELLDELAASGFRKYQALKQHPRFLSYLETMTPLKYIGDANIGSRPSRRGQSEQLKLEDLRAIPFVGAWSQMKQNIPGYYGLGAALAAMEQAGRLAAVQDLYRNSLFFRTLVGNAMQSLSKTFFPATAYLRDDPEYGEFWCTIHDEYQLSKALILKVANTDELLAMSPAGRESIRVRERMVLPLITIQQFALQTLRHLDDRDQPHQALLQNLVLRSMFGIINAARNAV